MTNLIKTTLVFCLISTNLISQNISLNKDYIYSFLRFSDLDQSTNLNSSLTIRPISINQTDKEFLTYYPLINSKNFKLNIVPIELSIEYNSHHPYNRNNGSMIPNRGLQSIFSTGINFEFGPLEVNLSPEYHFSENKNFEGFWEGHYPEIWAKRYELWNYIDIPERFGAEKFNRLLFGQSYIKLSWKKISIGLSSENLWWGPSIRNSIMLSNHAEGFPHISINTNSPIETKIGSFEWQFVTGKLENSGFTPPRTDYEYGGRKLYVPKINQIWETDDWRYFQGFILTYNPKFLKGFSIGAIRWVQMYSALIEGKYSWMVGAPNYFPVFGNLFRKNDEFEDYEHQTDQAAGVFFRWVWKDSKAEIYAEYHHNDSRFNLRDLFLDSDHSRAATIGLQKIFIVRNEKYLFSWEWTQMEQTAGRLLRNARSWYRHDYIYDGYTNKGEVLGSSIGPGSNSHYFSLSKYDIENKTRLALAFEIIDQDNDFYYDAFSSAKDYRRYWKDLNFHFVFQKKFKNFWLSSNSVFSRSFNYQWELNDNARPYYHPGRDLNNFHSTIKLTYFFK